MQLEIYKVKNSLGNSTALATLFINSKHYKDNSIITSFSKYLIFKYNLQRNLRRSDEFD